MARTIDQLLREADDIIEKRAAARVSSVNSVEDDDSIEKMAAVLMSSPVPAPMAVDAGETAIKTTLEKVAQAIVLVETLMNIDKLPQLHAFEKRAMEQGYSEEQVAEFMEKAALKLDYKRLLPMLPILGAASAAGAGGAYLGHKKGKAAGEKAGYDVALKDVDKAMKEYQL